MTTTVEEFDFFAEKHQTNNVYLWSTQLAVQMASIQLKQDDPNLECGLDEYLRMKYTKNIRRNLDARRYIKTRGKNGDSDDDSSTIQYPQTQALVTDLSQTRGIIYETVIVNEIRALEIFLSTLFRKYADKLAHESNVNEDVKDKSNKLLSKLKANPRASIPLRYIYALFPAIEALAKNTTHKKSHSPMLASANGVSCHQAIELWREIRNLIIHHDGVIYREFRDIYSDTYFRLRDERGLRPHGPLPLGQKLKLDIGHATFCLTSCYQMASVLNLAAAGKHET